jgi:hypothetical protein
MLRLPIRSIGPMILFVVFWILLGSIVVIAVGNAEELGDKVEIVNVDYELDGRPKKSLNIGVISHFGSFLCL